jgi:hypothetical protein
MGDTCGVSDAFTAAINNLDEDAFQLLYGSWNPLEPRQVADLLSPSPLLPGTALTDGCEQLCARRIAQQPWQLYLPLDRSGDEWEFKRDPRVRVPWQRAVHTGAASHAVTVSA